MPNRDLGPPSLFGRRDAAIESDDEPWKAGSFLTISQRLVANADGFHNRTMVFGNLDLEDRSAVGELH